ncbi:hypothetical protein [Legionella sp.]|uniref:hypothetical protein n=1 Tax=Legionella sp. TaxID=459 RepID=UPI003CA4E10D
MPYLVKGNALHVFSAFGHPEFATQADVDDEWSRDILSTPFLGTPKQAQLYYHLWQQKFLAYGYRQGNMSAAILRCLLGPKPLKKENEDTREFQQQFVHLDFAYIDDKQVPCGFMIMYRRDNPGQWMMGLIRATHLAPEHRNISLLSSFDLTDKIKPEFKIAVNFVPFAGNQLIQQLGSVIPFENAFNEEQGLINKHFERINFITRTINVTQEAVSLLDPIDYLQLSVLPLFADNPALDLIMDYSIQRELPLSFAQLIDCCLEDSELRKALKRVKLTNDKRMNKNLLKMVLVYSEAGTLEKNYKLLDDQQFIKSFGAFMWSKEQIKLLSYFYDKSYEHQFIQLVLSEESYFSAVSRVELINPKLMSELPALFTREEKLKQLNYIHSLVDEDAKRLCLVFWIKSSLSLDKYKNIVAETEKYPLMASTLVALDTNNFVDEVKLEQLVFDRRKHLQKSIKHHFFSEKNEHYHCVVADIKKFNETELEMTSKALNVLRNSGITEYAAYHSVIVDEQAKSLRLFLSQIATISNVHERKVLIKALYAANSKAFQPPLVLQNDKAYLAAAKNLQERFMCVTLLQRLGFNDENSFWVAQEENKQAQCFRQIILRVETECDVISKRLFGSASDPERSTRIYSYIPCSNCV